jgi:hypothetical protein
LKFGNIVCNVFTNAAYWGADGLNLGDPLQMYAIDALYEYMGVPKSEIVYIDSCDMGSYNGEYLILPIYNDYAWKEHGNGECSFSSKIIPVFISVYSASAEGLSHLEKVLRVYAPIGCRDERTVRAVRELEIPAYLSGCVTAGLEKRPANPAVEKIFLADIPDSLKSHIPKDILRYSETISHSMPFRKPVMEREDAKQYSLEALKLLSRYRDEATMVISSRLHAIAPCVAMGIPVIMAVENCSWRYSWIDRYIPIYTPEMFKDIDWYPQPVEYEFYKRKIIDLMTAQISKAYEKYSLMYEVSDYYENRPRHRYGSRAYDLVRSMKGKIADDFQFVIWGCGRNGEDVLDALTELFPEARFVVAMDEYREGLFHDVEIVKSSELERYPNCFVFIANYSGRVMGYKKMEELGKREGIDFLYTGTKNG